MYPRRLVPLSFTAPTLSQARFDLQPMGPRHLDIDYEAIMQTGERLDGTMLPPGWLGDVSLFTRESDLTELHWHAREFSTKSSFAYIAVDSTTTKSLGCVYVNPSEKAGFEAEVTCWCRWMPDQPEWDQQLFTVVQNWMTQSWPFERVVYPGRSMSWAEWKLLPSSWAPGLA
jgi:hypothetical protein